MPADPQNLQQLLTRLADGRTPTDLAKEAKERGIEGLSFQTLYRLMQGPGGKLETYPPRTPTLLGLYRLLPVRRHELWDSCALSVGFDLEQEQTLMAASLPPRIGVLDAHPTLIEAHRRVLQAEIDALDALRPNASARKR
jgi:hypothetical protein